MDPVSCVSCVSWMHRVYAAETHETFHRESGMRYHLPTTTSCTASSGYAPNVVVLTGSHVPRSSDESPDRLRLVSRKTFARDCASRMSCGVIRFRCGLL